MAQVGRPSKYTPDMLPKIIELMKEGASLVEVSAEIGVNDETIQDWKDPKSPRYKEEFSVTIQEGVSLSAAWWQRMGRTNLTERDFQTGLWYANMKNRFGWRDKTETEQTIVADVTSNGETLNDRSMLDDIMKTLKDRTADQA